MAWSDEARAAAAEARRARARELLRLRPTGRVLVGPASVPRGDYAAQLRAARAKLRGKRGFAPSSKARMAREAVAKLYRPKGPSGQSAEMNYRLRMERSGYYSSKKGG